MVHFVGTNVAFLLINISTLCCSVIHILPVFAQSSVHIYNITNVLFEQHVYMTLSVVYTYEQHTYHQYDRW